MKLLTTGARFGVLLILLCSFGWAQGPFNPVTANRVATGGTLPTKCSIGAVYYKTGSSAGPYFCSAADTWTADGSGGGGSGTVNSGTIGQLGYYAATGTAISATGSTFVFNPTELTTPAAPTLATAGTPGATTYGYKLVRKNLVGGSIASSATTIATGNATLDGTNKISPITAPACTGTQTAWDVYRTTAGGTPSTTGLIISNAACGTTLADTGLAVILPFTSVPSTAYSVGTGSSAPYVNTSNGSAFGCAAFANNDVWAPYTESSTGLAVLVNSSCSDFDYTPLLSYLTVDTDTYIQGSTFVANLTAASYSSTLSGVNSIVLLNGGAGSAPATLIGYQNIVRGNSSSAAGNVYVSFNTGNVHTVSGNLVGSYVSMADAPGGGTVAGDLLGFYANIQHSLYGGVVSGKAVAWFNTNISDITATGGAFAWYSEGGTNHLETGAATAIGMEIERHAGQSVDLFQFLDSDGTTVLSRFDKDGIIRAAGYKSSDGSTGATVTTCTGFKNGLCISGT